MNKIIPEKLNYYFDKCWNETSKEFFKLETLQFYASDMDWLAYREYQAGNISLAKEIIKKDLEPDRLINQQKKAFGVQLNRIHIIDIPLTDYLKFEIETYKVLSELGENISLIDSTKLLNLKINLGLKDFILFDEKYLLINYFDKKGNYIHSEISNTTDEIAPYLVIKEQLKANSIELNEFLTKNRSL